MVIPASRTKRRNLLPPGWIHKLNSGVAFERSFSQLEGLKPFYAESVMLPRVIVCLSSPQSCMGTASDGAAGTLVGNRY
jgi:hypothetical protein